MAAPLIDALINKRDNAEIVRDEIAAILLAETTSQQALAITAAEDPEDWAFDVYLERSNPWAVWADLPETATSAARVPPIVNVSLDNVSYDSGNVVERQKATGIFYVDCYGYGVSHASGAGHVAGDEAAAIEAVRVARLARNILMAATYTYLGMVGVVWKRWPRGLQVFQPRLGEQNVQHVVGARLTMQVEFNEFSPQVTGQTIELVSTSVFRKETGQLYFKADYPATP